ncbi:hypothetical protein ACA910_021476 [Epithemia clementina (nom. ined.)]
MLNQPALPEASSSLRCALTPDSCRSDEVYLRPDQLVIVESALANGDSPCPHAFDVPVGRCNNHEADDLRCAATPESCDDPTSFI